MVYPSQMWAWLHGSLFICVFVGMLVSVCLSSSLSMHRFIRTFFFFFLALRFWMHRLTGSTATYHTWAKTHLLENSAHPASKCEQRFYGGTCKCTDKCAWKYTHWYESLDLFSFFSPEVLPLGIPTGKVQTTSLLWKDFKKVENLPTLQMTSPEYDS